MPARTGESAGRGLVGIGRRARRCRSSLLGCTARLPGATAGTQARGGLRSLPAGDLDHRDDPGLEDRFRQAADDAASAKHGSS